MTRPKNPTPKPTRGLSCLFICWRIIFWWIFKLNPLLNPFCASFQVIPYTGLLFVSGKRILHESSRRHVEAVRDQFSQICAIHPKTVDVPLGLSTIVDFS